MATKKTIVEKTKPSVKKPSKKSSADKDDKTRVEIKKSKEKEISKKENPEFSIQKKVASKQKNQKSDLIDAKESGAIKTKSKKSAEAKDTEGSQKGVDNKTQEKIIAMKRRLHLEIFQKCLEKKLFSNIEDWAPPESEREA